MTRFPWAEFTFLIVTAVACYYARNLILVIAGLVLIVRGWWWLTCRFPKTMTFVNYFLAGLIGGRRRRRW